jgi:lipopolysaccharide export system protein LptA
VKVRRLDLVVLACGVLFAVVLVFSFRPGRRPTAGRGAAADALASSDRTRGQATTLLDGFDFTESVSGKPLMHIKADRTIGYGPGAGLPPDLYAGEKVTLTVYPDDGAPVTVHSERGEYDERTREAKLTGNVRWSDEQASLAETEEILFHPSRRLLEAPKTVHFTRGSIDLIAPSARYDLGEKALKLAGPIEGAGLGSDSGGLSKLTARQGVFRREAGVLELESVDGTSKSGDRYAADKVTVKTGSSGGHTEWIHGEGNVRGILAAAPSASGPDRTAVERQYSGEQSMLTFDAQGKPRTLSLTGAPALLSEAARRLTAPQIGVLFEDGRAASATATGGVHVEGENSHAEAEKGTLGFSKDGVAQNIALEGAVKVLSDGRTGDATRAIELDAAGLWLLTGDAAHAARVTSGGSRLSADRIELDRPRQQVRGEGRARAVLGADPQKGPRTATFVGDPNKPSFAKADRIVLDETTHVATLSGSASLWQDDSSLFADDITLSDAEKTVNAVQNVRAVLAPDRTGKSTERAASTVTARRLLYRDTERSGRFEGGVTVTRGAGWRATGGESTAWIGKDHGVDCMEISGDVDLTDHAAGRTAKAEKAVDYPKQGKTVLWGAPARVTDAGGNQVAGAVLTIFDRGRSVEITAPEGGKTETIHRTEKN